MYFGGFRPGSGDYHQGFKDTGESGERSKLKVRNGMFRYMIACSSGEAGVSYSLVSPLSGPDGQG